MDTPVLAPHLGWSIERTREVMDAMVDAIRTNMRVAGAYCEWSAGTLNQLHRSWYGSYLLGSVDVW